MSRASRSTPRTAEELLRTFSISIDGPSGSGKTTTARLVARELGLRHVDTGAMYRAATLIALERGIDLGDGERLGAVANDLEIFVEQDGRGEPCVRVGERDVTDAVRSPQVTAAVSAVSAHPAVRAAMVRRQRELSEQGGVILEGRDIGSVVLPWADVKIYLDATVRVRAQRRHAELSRGGVQTTIDEVERDLVRRDTLDASRADSPLVRPIGAWLVDTSQATIEGEVARVVSLARAAAAERAASFASREPRQRMRLPYHAVILIVRSLYFVLFGLRWKSLLETEPAQNYLFASNHISYFDPPAVSITLPREVHFVAKDSLFKIWWLGPLIRYLNAFPIKRGVFDREAMATALSLLESGQSVLIFPEGGRIAGGELGAARSGVGYLAVLSGVPVVPVYLAGTDRLKDCLFRKSRVRVIHGKPIRIPAGLIEEYRSQDDRAIYRRHSDMVMAAVQALKERRR
ncbi:MAG TPA: (d)CMP kinase [Candidatus Krumholzibacteria bacterium]|nr:(d)CMP kinase [Candidatus Krumholzibacteria bacterium]